MRPSKRECPISISNLFIIIEFNINGETSDGDDDDNNFEPSSDDDEEEEEEEEDSPPPQKLKGTCLRNICGNWYFHWKKMELIFTPQN